MSRYSHSVIIQPTNLREEPYPTPPRMARGTMSKPLPLPAPPERLGTDWFFSMQLELLGRNLATAGGLETSRRLAKAELEIEGMQTTQLAGKELIAALQSACAEER